MGLGAYEGSKCAYCDRRGATIYVDKTEDFYCKNCYTEYKIKPKSIKSFKIFTDDTDKVLVGNDIETALEILENNGYIIEVEYK